MERVEALRKLVEKVEAGTFKGPPYLSGRGHDRSEFTLIKDAALAGYIYEIKKAFNGSLDAALALHEAVLPGWAWSIYGGDEVEVERGGNEDPDYIWKRGADINPARAWLIAVLRALVAQEERQPV